MQFELPLQAPQVHLVGAGQHSWHEQAARHLMRLTCHPQYICAQGLSKLTGCCGMGDRVSGALLSVNPHISNLSWPQMLLSGFWLLRLLMAGGWKVSPHFHAHCEAAIRHPFRQKT